MDAQHFDRLTRLFARRSQRRGLARLLAGGAAAAVLPRLDRRATAAQDACPEGGCDPCAACGECEDCEDGVCVPRTGGPCRDDGVSCTVSRCVDGVCVHIPDNDRCPNPSPCTASACDGIRGCLTIPMADGANPAGCEPSDNPCRPRGCRRGVCAERIFPDGTACGNGMACSHGVCCPAGHVACDGGCVDTDTDPAFCGDCDTRCRDGETCCDGVCIGRDECCTRGKPGCPRGQRCTDGRCAEAEAEAEAEAGAAAGAQPAAFSSARSLSCSSSRKVCRSAEDSGHADRCCPRGSECDRDRTGKAVCRRRR